MTKQFHFAEAFLIGLVATVLGLLILMLGYVLGLLLLAGFNHVLQVYVKTPDQFYHNLKLLAVFIWSAFMFAFGTQVKKQ